MNNFSLIRHNREVWEAAKYCMPAEHFNWKWKQSFLCPRATGMSLLHIEVGSFFFRYSDLFFDVETGPAPAFVFTLSLTFDYKDRVYFPVMDCLPRWQMTAKEHAVVQNHTKGNDMGMHSCHVIFHVLRQIILVLTVWNHTYIYNLVTVLLVLIPTFVIVTQPRSELSDDPILKNRCFPKCQTINPLTAVLTHIFTTSDKII